MDRANLAEREQDRWHKLRRLVVDVVYVQDTAFLEIIHYLYAVAWGMWNWQVIVESNIRSFADLGYIDLSPVLSSLAIVGGVAALAYVLRGMTEYGHVRARRHTAMGLCAFWSVVLLLHLKQGYYTPSTIVYPLLIGGQAWIYWRLGSWR